MTVPLYDRVRRFTTLFVIMLLFTLGSATVAMVWQETRILQATQQNTAYHLLTVQSATEAIKELRRMEIEVWQHHYRHGPNSKTENVDKANPPQPAERPRIQNHVLLAEADLTSIIESQNIYKETKFERPINRIRRELTELTHRSKAILSGQGAPDTADLLLRVGSLILAFSQLERLHLIAYSEANRQIKSRISRRNFIVIPAALVILICGFFVLRYLTAQTRSALYRMQESDQALNNLNRELEARVDQRTAELKEAQGALLRKERLAAVGQVTATVSHELRNPLGAVRSASDAIKKFTASDDRPQMNRALALLERSQIRCDKIITELLDFTRVRELDRRVTRVDEWLADLIEDCEIPSDIELCVDLESGVEIAFDRDRLERSVRNVIDNACHAMAGNDAANGHQLNVGTSATQQRMELSIKDTGRGIAPAEQARVFEPLYSTKAIGVGLGLPMVKQIMEQHDGGIEITSELGHGTEVVLWLPLSSAERKVTA